MGYRAVCALAKAPDLALSLFKERLKAVPERDKQKIKRLIADLDSSEFDVRQGAQKELAALNGQAEPELRQVLADSPTPEVRKAIGALLDGIDPHRLDADRLRQIRAVQVLEYIGTSRAFAVLETLAVGEPLAELTGDARDALQRLRSLGPQPVPTKGKDSSKD